MAWVTKDLIEVWESGLFVGENTPAAVVQVQLGHWVRGWYRQDELAFPPVKAKIWGEGSYATADAMPGHWSAKWFPVTPFYDVPNLSSIKRTKDFSQNGVTVLEVILDAQDFVPKEGALGDAYHAIAPGWLAPTRNYVAPGRGDPRWETNEWAPDGEAGRITDSVIVRVWQGFGVPEIEDGTSPPVDGGSNGAWTFRGMIDDVDLDGDPNQITITARNGKLLTDQRVFRASKSVQLKDPITFYDTLSAEVTAMCGSGARASSEQDKAHAAKYVLDFPNNQYSQGSPAYTTRWRSSGTVDSSTLEWIEIRLPQGYFEDFWIVAPKGYECYVGIYAKPIIRHKAPTDWTHELVEQLDPPQMDGTDLSWGWDHEGWVDVGHGSAPGDHGGWPYLFKFTTGREDWTHDLAIERISLKHGFNLGKHSILRIGMTLSTGSGPAEVADLHALRHHVQKDVEQQQFILVDDASEVIKVVLRWAGYQQWDVEEAGVRLSDGTNYGPGVVAKASGRLVYNRSKYLIDIIQDVAKQLGFIFFLADPRDANTLDGIPTFRRDSSLLVGNEYIAADLNEATMLTGLKVKHTDADRPAIIRVRGKTAAARDGGVPLGGDSIQRIMAVYFPPWAFGARSGGVLRHIVFQDDQLITYAQCLYGCMLIALQAALQMHTAVAEIPGHPMLELDDQVSVLDEATGTNSRLWIIKSEDTLKLGQASTWKQTLEGSLLDSQDFAEVMQEILGHAGFWVGTTGPVGYYVEKIDWRHVHNPMDGQTSGYVSPVIKGSRTPRTR